MVEVSVIVPVYKTKKYLSECIDSILAQSFSDFELILVDDGSPDGSGALCDAAAARDRRVRVLHQVNQGVHLARRHGVEAAAAEYVVFADSDDTMAPNLLETVLPARAAAQADLLQYGFCKLGENGAERLPAPEFRIEGAALREKLLPEYLAASRQGAIVSGSLWNKILRRSLLREAFAHTPPRQTAGEDFLTVAYVLTLCQRVAGISDCLYYYRQHAASVTHGYSILRRQQEPDFWRALGEIAARCGCDTSLYARRLERRYAEYIPDCCVSTLSFAQKRRELAALVLLVKEESSHTAECRSSLLCRSLLWLARRRFFTAAIVLGAAVRRAAAVLKRNT